MFPSSEYDEYTFSTNWDLFFKITETYFPPVNGDNNSTDKEMLELERFFKLRNDMREEAPDEIVYPYAHVTGEETRPSKVPEWIKPYCLRKIKEYENLFKTEIEEIWNTGEGGGLQFDLVDKKLEYAYELYDDSKWQHYFDYDKIKHNLYEAKYSSFIINSASDYWEKKHFSQLTIDGILKTYKERFKDNDVTSLESFIIDYAKIIWYNGDDYKVGINRLKYSLYDDLNYIVKRKAELKKDINRSFFHSNDYIKSAKIELETIGERIENAIIIANTKIQILECMNPKLAKIARQNAPEQFYDAFNRDIKQRDSDEKKEFINSLRFTPPPISKGSINPCCEADSRDTLDGNEIVN